jgi:hypothetical protein
VGRRRFGFLDDAAHGSIRVEIDNAIAFRIGHALAEDRAATVASRCACKHLGQSVTEKILSPSTMSEAAPSRNSAVRV